MTRSISFLAYEVAKSQLVNQKEDLKNLRNQASFSAAVNGLVATVFASLASERIVDSFTVEPVYIWFGLEAWLVLMTFGASLCFSILVF